MKISRVSVAVVCGLIACDENVSRVPFLNNLKVRHTLTWVGKDEKKKEISDLLTLRIDFFPEKIHGKASSYFVFRSVQQPSSANDIWFL